MNTSKSNALFEKAKNLIPGGVNSPVRAFKAVGGNPLFIKSAKGAFMYDEDGNKFIDLINSWGPMLFGHAHEEIEKAVRDALQYSFSFGAPTYREVQMAEKIISMVPSLEKVRMVNSGTEATMAAIRVARGFTGKSKIIKFEGCYHGHGDSFLIAAGSGAITLGAPDSPGVTQGVANDTLTVPFNNIVALQQTIDANKNQIAALIIEPVVGNMGCVPPNPGYLEFLRKLCTKENIVLIFDEVMTGFRLARGGAQEKFNVQPDLTTLGKIIGGGMPVGAYGGKKEIMDMVSPAGPVYQAGTLSGNPIAMAAGMAMLELIDKNPGIYSELESITSRISKAWLENTRKVGIKAVTNQVGSMFTLFLTDKPVVDFETAKSADLNLFGKYFRYMLEEGVYLAPSQFESLFVSASIDSAIADELIEKQAKVMSKISNEI